MSTFKIKICHSRAGDPGIGLGRNPFHLPLLLEKISLIRGQPGSAGIREAYFPGITISAQPESAAYFGTVAGRVLEERRGRDGIDNPTGDSRREKGMAAKERKGHNQEKGRGDFRLRKGDAQGWIIAAHVGACSSGPLFSHPSLARATMAP